MPDLIWENKEKNCENACYCKWCVESYLRFLFLCNTFVRVVVMLFGIKQLKQNKNISKYLVERI